CVTVFSYVSKFVFSLSGLTPVILVSPPPSVVVHPGDNVTLQCTNGLKGPGHVAWFKQVNVSEPLCIASMYSSQPFVKHHNGFQPSHMEMFISNRTIVLKITEVNVADSGVYFCGMYNQYLIFTNMTFLMVQGNLFNYFSAVTTGCNEMLCYRDAHKRVGNKFYVAGILNSIKLSYSSKRLQGF
uniref:Ig-like domain-containing protein n=1 Tax=Oncorhynchus mykiss TaxID=8022 RepID=A0A8C7Q8I7_ONCMY